MAPRRRSSCTRTYNAEIRRLVPRGSLLMFNVEERWDPLCGFLNERVPDAGFPSRNSKVDFSKRE